MSCYNSKFEKDYDIDDYDVNNWWMEELWLNENLWIETENDFIDLN